MKNKIIGVLGLLLLIFLMVSRLWFALIGVGCLLGAIGPLSKRERIWENIFLAVVGLVFLGGGIGGFYEYFLELSHSYHSQNVIRSSAHRHIEQAYVPVVDSSVRYVASVSQEPFHKPSCRWAKEILRFNAVYYSTREEAIRAGHRPCRVCSP